MNNEEKILSIVEVIAIKVSDLDAKFNGLDVKFNSLDAKVDAMDAKFTDKFNGLDAKVNAMDTKFTDKFNGLDARINAIEQGQARLETDVADIKITLENEIRPKIELIAEGHINITRRLDHIQPIVENLEKDVSAIKAVVSVNSQDIILLKNAKSS